MDLAQLKQKGLSAVFWNFFGIILRQGISFIISIFLARLLSPSDFGLVGMATVFITFTQGFADLGLSSGLILSKKPTESEYSSVFYFNLAVSGLLMIAMFLSAGFVADYYKVAEIKPIIRFISYSFLIYALTSVHQAIFYRNMDVKIIRLSAVISTACTGVLGIVLAYSGFGVWSLIYSTLFGSLVSVIIFWLHSKWRPKLIFRFSDIKKLMPFGFRVFMVNYLDQIYTRIDVLVIGKMFSPAVLGQYFRAASFNQFITKYSSQGLSGIFFPVISRINEDFEAMKHVFRKALNAVCFISFFLTGFLFVNAEPLIILIFSAKWAPAIQYFRILAFSSYVFPMTIVFNGILQGTGNSGNQLRLEIIKKALGVTGLGIGFIFGIQGYLWSLAVTSALGLIISLIYIKKAIHIGVLSNLLQIYSYVIPLFAGIGITFLINLNPVENLWIKLIISSAAFCLTYILLCPVFRLSGFFTVKNIAFNLLKKKRQISLNA